MHILLLSTTESKSTLPYNGNVFTVVIVCGYFDLCKDTEST